MSERPTVHWDIGTQGIIQLACGAPASEVGGSSYLYRHRSELDDGVTCGYCRAWEAKQARVSALETAASSLVLVCSRCLPIVRVEVPSIGYGDSPCHCCRHLRPHVLLRAYRFRDLIVRLALLEGREFGRESLAQERSTTETQERSTTETQERRPTAPVERIDTVALLGCSACGGILPASAAEEHRSRCPPPHRPSDALTLADACLAQMTRVRDEVLPAYLAIGPAGVFAVLVIRLALDRTARALAEQDASALLGLHAELAAFA